MLTWYEIYAQGLFGFFIAYIIMMILKQYGYSPVGKLGKK